MKSFLIKLLIFNALVFFLAIVLGEVKYSDEFIASKTKGTAYEKVGWNLDIINNYPERIKNSTIFLGSSYVLNGVNDSVLSFNDKKVINMAVKHNGNDLGLYFLNRIKKLQPKEVISLKHKFYTVGFHKLSPLLYRPSEYIANGQTVNLYFVKYLFKRVKLTLEYLFYTPTKTVYKEEIKFFYGVRYAKNELSKDYLKKSENINKLNRIDEGFNLYQNGFNYISENLESLIIRKAKSLLREIKFRFSNNSWLTNSSSQEAFVYKAKEISRLNKFKFSQLYIPVMSDLNINKKYKRSNFMPLESDASNIYEIKDYSFLNSGVYWVDLHHLSKEGSILFTKALAKKMK
ncbi:hypothetical protein Celly_2623 [Cellulophaga lytica DSM 7489]|uniref:SGNH/GDSL hydrolase family protein n=1 Tax=Cellulophaga lytica (strain ATCC 23178 / DSM 7489 / JCM 8516 / NBRC 14961 / NCIMB 1423 / VKM B-1433 / Cy l20) TaxID=867900 RepID=F0R9U5_CELLC|nr:hypothetical protein [Cellulophaga lytica]ADY30440.1 hypothetical protein Celly_2623 [Cellulophaga lytica DSM 7489]WQG78628.1 hypothetical protein SR888_06760 [Cellulophaga lytica]